MLETSQPELRFPENLVFLATLAGLCHDIGHVERVFSQRRLGTIQSLL